MRVKPSRKFSQTTTDYAISSVAQTARASLPQWGRRRVTQGLLGAPLLLSACAGEEEPGSLGAVGEKNAVVQWNEIFLAAVRAGTLGPPMVARAMAIMNTAIFDAWAATTRYVNNTTGMPKARFRPTVEQLGVAISFAAYRTLVNLYPDQKSRFDQAMQARGLMIDDVEQSVATPSGLGNLAAARVIEARRNDGANQYGLLAPGAYADYTGYTAVNTVDVMNDPNHWQPMRFSDGRAPGFMVPHWGRVRPFSLPDGAAIRPVISLPRFGSRAYKEEADFIIQTTAQLTDEQKVIAEFWANGPRSETPPGQWNLFLQQLSVRRGNSLNFDVQAFFALSNAVMDAGIVCWDCKRFYDSARPISAIRTLYRGQTVTGFRGPEQGIGPMPGEQWSPYQPASFITPPFAEFTSGHSTFSAAAAEVLTQFYGSDAFGFSVTVRAGDPTALTQVNVPARPVTLSWATFGEAAKQASDSRIYGGIHFEAGCNMGLSSGTVVGQHVMEKFRSLLNNAPVQIDGP